MTVISWFAFIIAPLSVMVGINLIVREISTEREKLPYPVMQLPMTMTEEGFFSHRTM